MREEELVRDELWADVLGDRNHKSCYTDWTYDMVG